MNSFDGLSLAYINSDWSSQIRFAITDSRRKSLLCNLLSPLDDL